MSNTTNLGLFKHDNPPTNENQFDVEKSLNENWDKIDEFAGEQKDVNSKVTTQEQQIENLNEQYTQLNQGLQAANNQIGVLDSLKADRVETENQFKKFKTDQERQDKQINGLKDSAINITTDKQKSLHITDSSNLGAKILPFGNREQETRSGKNILNINSSELYKPNSTTIKIEENKINVTSNNNPVTSFASIPIDVEPNTDYMFSGIAKVVSNSLVGATSSYVKVREEKNSGSWVSGGQASISQNNTQNQELSFTFNSGEHTRVWLWLYIKTGDATGIISVDFSDLQVEKGTEQTEYEKYGESPSSQFPSPIKNVGDNINLINEENLLNYTPYGATVTSTVIQASTTRRGYLFECKPNTAYTIQRGDTTAPVFIAFCFDENPIENLQAKSTNGAYADTLAGPVDKKITFKTTANSKYIYVVTSTNEYTTPSVKAEEGEIATSYSPYNCGNIGISVFNKNWADGNRLAEEMKSFSSTASEEVVDGRQCVKFENSHFLKQDGFKGLKNNYKENTQYTISIQVRVTDVSVTSGKTLYLQIYDKQGNMIGFKNTEAKGKEWITLSYTMPKNTTLSYIAFSFGTFAYWYLDKDSIQIYEATDEGDCPVYEGQKIVFPLEEGQRLMLGDYLGEDEKIHHVRKQISLDETKDWKQSSVISSVFYLDLEENITQDTTKFSLICNQYVYGGILEDTVSNAKNNEIYGFISNSTLLKRIVLRNDNFTDLQSFKNSLSEQKGIPLILEFNLAEEETEDFTEEQKTVFEQLQNCDMYKPITNITTEDNMALIEAQYIADTKTYIDNKYNNLAQQIINQITGGN